MSGKLKEIRGRISSVNSTQQITIAMKMVSAAKLRKSQDRIATFKIFSTKLKEILESVMGSLGKEQMQTIPLANAREVKKILFIVITSDRGLCGAFNANIIKKVVGTIERDYKKINKRDIIILPIGKKGYDFFKKQGYSLVEDYKNVMSEFSIEKVEQATKIVMDKFLQDDIQVVNLFYAQFKNASVQYFVNEPMLPFSVDNKDDEKNAASNEDYIFEPKKETLLLDLIPKTLQTQFMRAVFDTSASEHGARMVAMEKASENAKELLRELKLSYNKARQDAITTELSEIVAGAASI